MSVSAFSPLTRAHQLFSMIKVYSWLILEATDQLDAILLAPTLIKRSKPLPPISPDRLVLVLTEAYHRYKKQPKIMHESQVVALWKQAGLSPAECKAAWLSLFQPKVSLENPDNLSYFRFPGGPRLFCGAKKVKI